MENRLHERYKTRYECRVESDIAFRVKVKDVSIGGICLETPNHIKKNDIYQMQVVTKKNEKIHLIGEVVRSSFRRTRIYKGDIIHIYDVGLHFIKQNSSQKRFLKRLSRRLAH